jgi:hypothetical protein
MSSEQPRENALRRIVAFLDSIEGEGAGYGGMAEYETARKAARDMADDVELAYGMLWHASGVRGRWAMEAVDAARKELLRHIDKPGQARGITNARELLE